MRILSALCLLAIAWSAAAEDVRGHNLPSPERVAEVESGARTAANAAWWGFDPEDATETLQAAIDSGAKSVLVPYVGQPWIIRPVKLRSNLEIEFEPGVLILAKRGEFKGKGDSLFAAVDMENIVIRGYGATLRMWKQDYQNPPYEKAEWRMGIRLMGCKNVLVEGVRVESSGGDGFYVGSSGQNRWCEDVTIRDCVAHDNHRQGLSVISARNLLVENCVFSHTGGTPPEAGIDLEADSPDEMFVNCVIRNCVFESNSGHAILVYLKPMTRESEDVSIRFENCHSRMGSPGMAFDDFQDMDQTGWAGISVGAIKDDGPKGLIEFVNCTTENTGKEGIRVYDKSPDSATVRFVNCSVKQPWVSTFRNDGLPRVPIILHARRPHLADGLGGVEFIDCHVYDNSYRPAIRYEEDTPSEGGLQNITGTLYVHNPVTTWAHLGEKQTNVTLDVVDATPEQGADGADTQ